MSLRMSVRAGDPAAFGVLFDDCARSIYNTAFRLTGNWSTTEDVVSLTFLEAWRRRARWNRRAVRCSPGCWASA